MARIAGNQTIKHDLVVEGNGFWAFFASDALHVAVASFFVFGEAKTVEVFVGKLGLTLDVRPFASDVWGLNDAFDGFAFVFSEGVFGHLLDDFKSGLAGGFAIFFEVLVDIDGHGVAFGYFLASL